MDQLAADQAGNFVSQTKDLSPRAFDAIANIVLHGTFYMTNACGKRWIAESRKASVLSILTTWVWTGSPFVVPSAMSKAGVAVMTTVLGQTDAWRTTGCGIYLASLIGVYLMSTLSHTFEEPRLRSFFRALR